MGALGARAADHPGRHHPRQPAPHALPALCGARRWARASGTSTAASTSTTGWDTAPCSWGTPIRPSSRRSRSRSRSGTHYGACHELEVEWAEWITRLIPSAEMVRFTMSGTEATHLALRLARAYTGRPKVVKFTGHFHGWHDGVSAGVNPPFDVPMSAGIPGAVLGEILLAPPNDIGAVEQLLNEPERHRRRHPRAQRRPGRRLPDRPRVPEGPATAHAGSAARC